MTIHEIVEQKVVFDGQPRFYVGGAALLGLLNHLGYGDLDDARADLLSDPRQYLVRVRIEYEKIK